ncbi:hypothetical protein LOZ80_27495 [Paenibacillus sp. HWE-109]|uniref:hypothetical protein n=1 Tax=Paenibacillus sp. HWE-109 TaxID=1306526 RepID=UPI001EDCD51B|nr:hypothetical protein [Paenibacillus sp. HWE-109]UKS25313.1 hypothetical protein LOZ80_27495 [Paenibacillus sp. HWE-109]
MKTQFKRYTSRVSLLAVVATMAFGAISASAAETNSDNKNVTTSIQATQTVAATGAFQLRSSAPSLLFQPAHQRNYLKLLASTYSPESLKEWKQALEDRKQAESEMPQMAAFKSVSIKDKDGGAVPSNAETVTIDGASITNMDTAFVTGIAVPAVPATKVGELPEGEPTPGKKIFMERLSEDGAVLQDTVQALPLEGVVTGDIMKGELPESFKRQQKLADAVEADDTATIKSLLPELLKDYKAETENIRSLAKKLKEAADKAKENATNK